MLLNDTDDIILKKHLFQDTRSSEAKTKEVTESLCHISESTTWKGFFSALSENGNQQVADKIREDIAATAMAEQIEEGSKYTSPQDLLRTNCNNIT